MPRRRAVFALLVLILICVRVQAADKNFHWGVNGHPCLQEGYLTVPISTQIDLLAQLGAHWYRSDWPAETVERTPEVYDALIAEAARRKVHILPIIFPPLRCDNKQA